MCIANEENQNQAVRKQFFFLCEVVASKVLCVLFLMRSCSIQSFVLHSDNDHMQKSISCDLRLSIWRRI